MAFALDGGVPESDSGLLAAQGARTRSGGQVARFSLQPISLAAGNASQDSVLSTLNHPELSRPTAGPESLAVLGATTETRVPSATFDRKLVKETFSQLLTQAPAVVEQFYDRLFALSPESRALFPTDMSTLREHVFGALTQLIWSLDTEADCVGMLSQLGCQHRKFGVADRHYQAFCAALRGTVQHFIGPAWRPDVAAAWQGALDYTADVMRAAAAVDAVSSPPWWVAEIVEHELRAPGVAVLKLAPDQPLAYASGQYLPVQVTNWPRVWRPFSIANAPRPGGLIELHVRAVPGGLVSNALVYHSVVGDTVLLGAPTGQMTLAESNRDLLCVAGGTGLAPIKAVIEQVISAASAKPRKITLFFGARQHFDLYDLRDLQLLEAAYPPLQVIPVLSDQPTYRGLKGQLPDVVYAQRSSAYAAAEAYICGPPPMVSQTAQMLAATLPEAQIHHDPLPQASR